MSSDFSIKPVGTPVATPLPPVSPAAEQAVATDLPAPQSVAAADAGPHARNDTQNSGGHTSNHVILDRDAGSVVYQVVDNRTSLVVKQFPDQGMLRRRAYARALEQAREDVHALRIDRQI
ncbi:hypothetical protein [Bradyrhizobium sp.]|jgi:hypothetical protein|uniref:hypothetical protein n=1 Tax=Bradyrhizobium sp. TaxID=376 RepID=UPI002DFCF1F0|nr:hypothetical protein [Bradyrhizobium sp.]